MAVAEEAVIRDTPDTSKSTVGVAVFTPIRPVVVSAVAVAEEAVIRDTPDTSKFAPGVVVGPIPSNPELDKNIRTSLFESYQRNPLPLLNNVLPLLMYCNRSTLSLLLCQYPVGNVKLLLKFNVERIMTAPFTSKSDVGGDVVFIPIRPLVVSAVATTEEAVICTAPDTSSDTVGVAVFTPIRPVVVSAVLAAEPEFTRASPPDMSKRTVGASVVVVPIFRLPLLSNRPISTPFMRNGIIFCNGSRLFTSI
jgi:hypothetical protein